jgi:PIN domain nuclease of toxin-antitoxin system
LPRFGESCGALSGGAAVEADVPRSYVLDTHACLFMLTAPRKLGARARAVIHQVEVGRAVAWLPAAVVAEVLMLRELGRTKIGLPELRAAMDASQSLRFSPLDLTQLDEFAALSVIRDPFDRLIVAAARRLGACLLTRDAALSESALVDAQW